MKTITVDDLKLKQIPGTQEFAHQIYDIFIADSGAFKHWFEGGMWKSVDEVLKYYQAKEKAQPIIDEMNIKAIPFFGKTTVFNHNGFTLLFS